MRNRVGVLIFLLFLAALLSARPQPNAAPLATNFHKWETMQYVPAPNKKFIEPVHYVSTNISFALAYRMNSDKKKANQFYQLALADFPEMKNFWFLGQPSIGYCFAMYHLVSKQPMPGNVRRELVALADNFSARLPYTGYINDSRAESNAWTAAFLATMSAALPRHAHAQQWEKAGRAWAKGTIVPGVTVYPDFLMDNHGHHPYPDYAFCAIAFLGRGALVYKMQGKPVPPEFTRNVKELYNAHRGYYSDWISTGSDDWGITNHTVSTDSIAYLKTLKIVSESEWQSFMSAANLPSNLTFPDAGTRDTQRANGMLSAAIAKALTH